MLRTGSWKIHAIVIFILLVVTTAILWVGAMNNVIPMQLQIAANFALNWTALAYAIFIYKLYDTSKQQAIKQAQEKGIEVPSVEEFLGVAAEMFKEADDWWKANKEKVEGFMHALENVDIEKLGKAIEKLTPELDKFVSKGEQTMPRDLPPVPEKL